jgi:hypothetical protein
LNSVEAIGITSQQVGEGDLLFVCGCYGDKNIASQ